MFKIFKRLKGLESNVEYLEAELRDIKTRRMQDKLDHANYEHKPELERVSALEDYLGVMVDYRKRMFFIKKGE